MNDKTAVIEKIQVAFGGVEFPGEDFLQGSFDGDEPYEEIAPFRTQKDWTRLDAGFLDRHAAALSFFSKAGFRFFLPAYLVADLNRQLETADPLFHLTHGFSDFAVEVPVGSRVFVIRRGKSSLINPRRYGAATFEDYARYRLSIFTRDEAAAIVAYLKFKGEQDDYERARVEAALDGFWLRRASSAPTAETLQRHLAEEREYLEALQSGV
jgi:hypothetical protein